MFFGSTLLLLSTTSLLLSTVATTTPTCNAPTYQGCFIDPFTSPNNVSHHVLAHLAKKDDPAMTPAKCIALCCAANYTIGSLAGVEHGSDCYCDTAFGPYTIPPSTRCTSPCTGNTTVTCGGEDAIATFTINACPNPGATVGPTKNTHLPWWTGTPSTTKLKQCGAAGCTRCPVNDTCCIGRAPDAYKVPGGYGCSPSGSNTTQGCASGGVLPNHGGCCCGFGPSIISDTSNNVLIVGDSVSAGYLPFVRAALNGTNVQHGPDNTGGGNADGVGYGSLCTKYFVRTPDFTLPPWALITFNYGLHDGSDSNSSYTNGLSSIADQMLETVHQNASKLLYFMTTIPGGSHSVPGEPVSPGNKRVIELNAIAAAIMSARNIDTLDLHATMVKCGTLCFDCKPHCGPAGYQYLVENAIAPRIEKALGLGG